MSANDFLSGLICHDVRTTFTYTVFVRACVSKTRVLKRHVQLDESDDWGNDMGSLLPT